MFLLLDLICNFVALDWRRVSVWLYLRVIFVLPRSIWLLLICLFDNLIVFIIVNYFNIIVVYNILLTMWVVWRMAFIDNLQRIEIVQIPSFNFNWLVCFEIWMLRPNLIGLISCIPFVYISHPHFCWVLDFWWSHHNRWSFHSAFDAWSVCFPSNWFGLNMRQLLLHGSISLYCVNGGLKLAILVIIDAPMLWCIHILVVYSLRFHYNIFTFLIIWKL